MQFILLFIPLFLPLYGRDDIPRQRSSEILFELGAKEAAPLSI